MSEFSKRDIDFPTRLSGNNRGGSILKDETWEMENKRREAEKTGHRKLGAKVHDREHYEPQAGQEQNFQETIQSHPLLDNPYFDGIADNENPRGDPEALIKAQNARNEQELQHRMKLGLQPKLSSAPEYKP
ncbi:MULTISPECIES: hypothetical protein [Legionella]|uniref:Putative Smr domain protein n=1 Tax=Legionella drozanskii LLAP-1 TaxID=1212489 RepID=A0A0W0SRS7_9GAMM|nr:MULTISPECIES: hypothetical protein [Legionella]KTC86014.1 putative Smr domain protein [Legionella drozanskii LLAP-1]PJE10015.1 MAG: hypothetical protein CK430_10640 [Legionella sp.]